MRKLLLRYPVPLVLGLGLTGASLMACDTNPNVERRLEEAQEQSDDQEAGCVHLCLPDPGPEPVDCEAAEEGVEFYPVPIWDFEGSGAGNYFASNLYTYDDQTTLTLSPTGWEAPAIEMERCRGEEQNGVMHLSGGPFLEWGGGVGRHMKCLNANGMTPAKIRISTTEEGRSAAVFDSPQPLDEACGWEVVPSPCSTGAEDDPLLNSVCPQRDLDAMAGKKVDPAEAFLVGATLDLSEWDGISFWARRSPNSQPGIRIVIGDKHTDDDLRYLQAHISPDQEPFCRINRECHCPDLSTECVEIDYFDEDAYERNIYPDGYFDDLTPEPSRNAQTGEVRYYCATKEDRERGYVIEANTIPCGQWACDDMFKSMQRADAQFLNKPCTEYALRGSIVEAYCWDPETDPEPAENRDLCGDHWMRPVLLSTKWELYKIPFTDFLQQGWAKESFHLDLTSVAVVRFTWDRGYIDYWLDDVRFYRNGRND